MTEASEYKGTKIKTLKFKDHAKKRSMWLGSLVSSEHEVFVLTDGLFQKQTLEFSDALFKCIDEILVNAIDQYINAINLPSHKGGPVTEIRISFNSETGEITVSNDGQGMPIYRMDDPDHPDLPEDQKPWTVNNIITKEFTGSNFDDEGSPDRVTGGINGLGIKVVNALCSRLEIETVDWLNFRFYNQVCHDGMNQIDEPLVVDLKNDRKTKKYEALSAYQRNPHTTLKFIPNYTELCKVSSRKKDPNWYNQEHGETVRKLIETRTYQLAAFVASTSYRFDGDECIEYKKKAKIYFNDKLIEIKSLSDYAMMYGLSNIVSTEIKSTATSRKKNSDVVRFPWSIAVNISPAAITDSETEGITYDKVEYKSFEQVSLLNAVHLTKGGSHVNALLKMIQDALRPRIERLLGTKYHDEKGKPKDLPANVLKNNLFIFNSLQIPIPQFAGQTKESVTLSVSDLKSFKETYELPKSFISAIWELLEPILKYKFLLNAASTKTSKKQNFVRKYEKAKFAGTRQAGKCGLIVPEGDSAETTMNSIITSRVSKLSKDYFGTYNIQGVPMNALKEIKEIVVGKHSLLKQSKRLQQNAGLQGLYQVLGLNYDYKYYTGPDEKLQEQGDKEFKSLNYGSGIIMAVDQDLDGIGQIASLILVYFMVFFPNLIKRGYVKRWASPVIRVYPTKGEILEFFSDKEFLRWRETEFGITADADAVEDIPSGYKVKYYKGLATHSKAEVEHMAESYEQNVYTFTWDDAAKEFMESMYGSDTNPRKAELKTPVTDEYNESMFEQQLVEISSHFRIETKSFQLDFMERKLPSAIDGMIPSQRKAFAGGRKVWGNGGNEMKVYQLTGYITKQLHYQHGDGPMNDTITKMAQTFTGSNNIPLFTPISNGFGDIKDGRSKTGQARYIETKLNNRLTDLMFPRQDDWLLPYAYDDGVQCEPKYYVPIMPFSVLNTITTVAVGWKIMLWARDYKFTFEQVRHMINNNYPDPAGEPESFHMKVWTQPGMSVFEGWYGKGSKISSEICVGDYEYNEDSNTVHITQLPLKLWSYKLKCGYIGCKPYDEKVTTRKNKQQGEVPLPKKHYIAEVTDNTGNNIVDMQVTLCPGAMEKIEEEYGDENIDPVMDYLGLKQNLEKQLNMINKDGGVIEFDTYEDIVKHWFPVRRKLYEDRLEREILLLRFKIIHLENVQRFILMEKNKKINVNDISEEKQDSTLVENDFRKINLTMLENPKYTKTNDLENVIFGESASYKYILEKITKRMCSTQQIEKREEEIKKLRAELKKLENSTYKDIWLEELDKLEKVIDEGIKTGWLYGQKQHTFKKVGGNPTKPKSKKKGKK